MSAARVAAAVILAGGLLAFALSSRASSYRTPEITYDELMLYLNDDGTVNLDPSAKPAVNAEYAGNSGWALYGARAGLGNTDFDWGAWQDTYEYWTPDNEGWWESGSDDPAASDDSDLWEDEIATSISADDVVQALADHLMPTEGYRSVIYDDFNGKPWSQSQIGNPTIGYGHLVTKKDLERYGWNWTLDGTSAYALLLDDVAKHLLPVVPYVTVPLTLNQWIVIGSLAFNAGVGIRNSRFIKAVNAGDIAAAEYEFKDFNKAPIKVKNPDGTTTIERRVVRGLTNRRAREWEQFIMPGELVALTEGGTYA